MEIYKLPQMYSLTLFLILSVCVSVRVHTSAGAHVW